MMGVRGVRLAVLHRGLYPAQARALFNAWLDVRADGIHPRLEVMIPLVSMGSELAFAADLVRREADAVAEQAGVRVPYLLGTMVETPRAALLAGELARVAEFLSFGTNDLTQLTYGLSRDDVERRLMGPYLEQGLLPASPFVALDADGVGELIALASARARAVRPDIKLGLCGEHGGHPESVALCHRLGLDYVSCSPQRVPLARLAAARAVHRMTVATSTLDLAELAALRETVTAVCAGRPAGPGSSRALEAAGAGYADGVWRTLAEDIGIAGVGLPEEVGGLGGPAELAAVG